MFNFKKNKLKKKAGKGYRNYNLMLSDKTKETDISVDSDKNINSSIPKKELDNIKTLEGQISENRKEKESNVVTEKQMDESEKVYNKKRSDDWDTPIMPINLESESYDQEKREAFKKEQTKDDDTDFWDKYIGVQLLGEKRKVDDNIPDSNSQLQNSPHRFKEKEPVKMVMASLKDADALLFHIYASASKENRELNNKEVQMINDINNVKSKLLAQMVPVMSPVEDEVGLDEVGEGIGTIDEGLDIDQKAREDAMTDAIDDIERHRDDIELDLRPREDGSIDIINRAGEVIENINVFDNVNENIQYATNKYFPM